MPDSKTLQHSVFELSHSQLPLHSFQIELLISPAPCPFLIFPTLVTSTTTQLVVQPTHWEASWTGRPSAPHVHSMVSSHRCPPLLRHLCLDPCRSRPMLPDSPLLRPPATQQPERPFETEISSRRCPALPPRTHTAGSSLPFRPQGKCHLLKEASLSPNPEQLPVTPCQRRGSSSRGRLTALRPTLGSAAPTEGLGWEPGLRAPGACAAAGSRSLAQRASGRGAISQAPRSPERNSPTPRGNCLRPSQPAPTCRGGGAREDAPQLRARACQPDRLWA